MQKDTLIFTQLNSIGTAISMSIMCHKYIGVIGIKTISSFFRIRVCHTQCSEMILEKVMHFWNARSPKTA